jgi:hypothetical protein
MNKELKIFNIDIDELDDSTGIELIAIVDRPAIESNFIKLSADAEPIFLKSDNQKRFVTGAVLIPEKLIYRRDPESGQEYYITFSADAIERIRNKFFRTGNLKLSNLDHSKSDEIQGFLIESWVVIDSEKDKAVALGFQDVKVGTLYCTYHFPDDATWSAVSERNGFSLEGNFLTKKEELEEVTPESLDDIFDLLRDE